MIRVTALKLAVLMAAVPHPQHHRKPKLHWKLGVASEYGGPQDNQEGNPLACGGVFERGTRGVANKTLACGTRVRICAFRRCVTTRVIDRGPYVAGRDFDLSYTTVVVDLRLPYPWWGPVRWRLAR